MGWLIGGGFGACLLFGLLAWRFEGRNSGTYGTASWARVWTLFEKGLFRERGLRVFELPGRRRAEGSWLGTTPDLKGYDDATVLRHWLPDLAERDVYVCGPPAWTDSLVNALLIAGLPAGQLHLENFSW